MGYFDLVVMGASLGGLRAMEVVLAGLPATFPLPVVAVLHRDARADVDLGAHLQGFCPLAVGEAEDKDDLRGGRVYLAPADYHLLVEKAGTLALSTEAPVASARPSIDVLFESAADAYGERLIAVVLTGASRDGAQGARRVRALGGAVLVEDPATAESRPMPAAALASATQVLPLAGIAPALAEMVDRSDRSDQSEADPHGGDTPCIAGRRPRGVPRRPRRPRLGRGRGRQGGDVLFYALRTGNGVSEY